MARFLPDRGDPTDKGFNRSRLFADGTERQRGDHRDGFGPRAGRHGVAAGPRSGVDARARAAGTRQPLPDQRALGRVLPVPPVRAAQEDPAQMPDPGAGLAEAQGKIESATRLDQQAGDRGTPIAGRPADVVEALEVVRTPARFEERQDAVPARDLLVAVDQVGVGRAVDVAGEIVEGARRQLVAGLQPQQVGVFQVPEGVGCRRRRLAAERAGVDLPVEGGPRALGRLDVRAAPTSTTKVGCTTISPICRWMSWTSVASVRSAAVLRRSWSVSSGSGARPSVRPAVAKWASGLRPARATSGWRSRYQRVEKFGLGSRPSAAPRCR